MLDVLDRRTQLTQVAQQQRHATAALRELQCRIDAARNRLHIVFHAQQEAADGLAALCLAEVQEGGGGGLEAPRDDGLQKFAGGLFVACRQFQRHGGGALGEVFEVLLAVEGFQCIGAVELERAEESGELEVVALDSSLGLGIEGVEELGRILREHLAGVIAVVDKILQPRRGRIEPHGVGGHVAGHELALGGFVFVELDAPVGVIQVEHGVQGMEIVLRVVWRVCRGSPCGLLGPLPRSPFNFNRQIADVVHVRRVPMCCWAPFRRRHHRGR